MIRAATTHEATRNSGEWLFVDIGFASKKASCGLLVGDDTKPEEISFAELKERLLEIVSSNQTHLNLVIEAPLSAAFNEQGNPTGRAIEKRNGETRYSSVGLGCSVLVATTYLLRAIHDTNPVREIRLFEGFASFKKKDAPTSHSQDVLNLRDIAWNSTAAKGVIVEPSALLVSQSDQIVSAFLVAGMDFGVPPVIVVA